MITTQSTLHQRDALARAARRVPPHAYFVVSSVFHYLGPAFAVLLFARIDVLGVAWLRIAVAAVIFAAWRRPWRIWPRLGRSSRILLVAWAAVLAVMNSVFYLALDRLPLGTVAAIEFLPVIALAAVAARTWRNLLALLGAVIGVYLLTDVQLASGIDGLGLSMLFAAVLALRIGFLEAVPAFADPPVLLAAIGVGVLLVIAGVVVHQEPRVSVTERPERREGVA